MPIIPDLGNYFMAIIECVIPYVLMLKVKSYFDNEEDKDLDQDINKSQFAITLIPIGVLVLIIYLTCGRFSYLSIAVASGSMVPTFHRGDVVIVKKVNDSYKYLIDALKAIDEDTPLHRPAKSTRVNGEFLINESISSR